MVLPPARLTEAPATIKPGVGPEWGFQHTDFWVTYFSVTLLRLRCYAGIRQILPGSQ
jgi:hypothetical protein